MGYYDPFSFNSMAAFLYHPPVLATECLTDPHGHNSWPLTPSHHSLSQASTHFPVRTHLRLNQITIRFGPWHIALALTQQKTLPPTVLLWLHMYLLW
jgi:hypothetical protein